MSEVLLEESEVKTPRHKRKLEEIRNGRRAATETLDNNNEQVGSAGGTGQGSHSQSGNNYSESGGRVGHESGGNEGTAIQPGTPGRRDERVRPLNGAAVNAAESHDRVEPAAPQQQHPDAIIEDFDSEAERERKRELNRQRQARYREKERAEGSSEQEALRVTSPALPPRVTPEAEIRVKNVTQNNAEPVKLLTKEEVGDSKDKLVFLYMKGSELLDDLLEIIVRDHEPVKIWALDEDEATMLAELQLERARKDKGAARVVRIMLKVYERWFWFMLTGPRAKATYSHIREHKGFSFK